MKFLRRYKWHVLSGAIGFNIATFDIVHDTVPFGIIFYVAGILIGGIAMREIMLETNK